LRFRRPSTNRPGTARPGAGGTRRRASSSSPSRPGKITHEPGSPTYRRLRTNLSDAEKKGAGAFRRTSVTLNAWERTRRIARLLRADKVLFQCPASFRPSRENKDRLRAFFGDIDREGLTCIWEPRGDWTDDDIRRICRDCNLVHCVDPFANQPVTGGLRYHRLHGISGYRHEFSDDELAWLRDMLPGRCDCYVLFNNRSMVDDARCFRRMMEC
jgi:uncharacterized protein YecE (DUF72 family)